MRQLLISFWVMLMAVSCDAVIAQNILYASTYNALNVHLYDNEFCQMDFHENMEALVSMAEENGTDFGSVAACYVADTKSGVAFDDSRYNKIREYLTKYQYEDFYYAAKAYNAIYDGMVFFPVAEDSAGQYEFYFENSYMADRSYGGERKHEGCDIMPSENISGKFPVISVCDGTVEKTGWLELGGYRLGIRSDEGVYFYYAHLQSYADEFSEGDRVRAGDVIGLMGDTGYGEEGTSGQFDVHLHFGIYVNDAKGNGISVNPYAYLKYVRDNVRRYNFGNSVMEGNPYAL